ncbi:Fatty-acid-binding protein 2 [Platanthera guangdongensis]|uniref:Chalcone--flavanone isomerase n=1 Tax=Platanthera guangdongensis TaxID=2320717 RepID=A0ABR2N579_9ASPA
MLESNEEFRGGGLGGGIVGISLAEDQEHVHFDSICKKLGHKYASVPLNELKDCSYFYEDLLRMAAGSNPKSEKEPGMNPNTDYECLRVFGSYFMEDIPLPVGTTIDFRRTIDGRLITEIGGKRIGVVQSKELCRVFFDMYIGDAPISLQTKHDIADNVAELIRKC